MYAVDAVDAFRPSEFIGNEIDLLKIDYSFS